MSGKMGPPPAGDRSFLRSTVVADPRARQVLGLLRARSQPLTDRDLAVRIAADEAGTTPEAVCERARRRVRLDLYHRCLPKLRVAGWIKRYAEGVVATDRLFAAWSELVAAGPLEPDSGPSPALEALLARPRRIRIASIVADERSPVALEDLAAELASLDGFDDSGTELGITATLHHLDLPMMAEAGLLEYDPGARVVSRTRGLSTFLERTNAVRFGADESDMDA